MFIQSLPRDDPRPHLLLLDGHSSHVSNLYKKSNNLLKSKNVHIKCFPHYCPHNPCAATGGQGPLQESKTPLGPGREEVDKDDGWAEAVKDGVLCGVQQGLEDEKVVFEEVVLEDVPEEDNDLFNQFTPQEETHSQMRDLPPPHL
ncbi:hypothetical protein PFLUV_G00074100 [Perca fluviatilis]|uniref:DDE-1 domain-containing protein n=1 Tax=Perca fluviatilis TaxID=8168 RepID=A0A6A5FHE8_PERFL|nr:hypothetical protein PFLUV_G00074100 [Perca fluviatilis]